MPLEHLVDKGGMKAVMEYIKDLGKEYYEALLDMIVYDAIILNTDRHYGNFGLIIDNKTNKPISFAPLFDHGASLFVYAMDNDEIASIESLMQYANTRSAIMYSDFVETTKTYMQKNQIEKIKKLINFKI